MTPENEPLNGFSTFVLVYWVLCLFVAITLNPIIIYTLRGFTIRGGPQSQLVDRKSFNQQSTQHISKKTKPNQQRAIWKTPTQVQVQVQPTQQIEIAPLHEMHLITAQYDMINSLTARQATSSECMTPSVARSAALPPTPHVQRDASRDVFPLPSMGSAADLSLLPHDDHEIEPQPIHVPVINPPQPILDKQIVTMRDSRQGSTITTVAPPTRTRTRTPMTPILALLLIQAISETIACGLQFSIIIHKLFTNTYQSLTSTDALCTFEGWTIHFFGCFCVGNLLCISIERHGTITSPYSIHKSSNSSAYSWYYIFLFFGINVFLAAFLASIPWFSSQQQPVYRVQFHGLVCLGAGRNPMMIILIILYSGVATSAINQCYINIYRHVKKTVRDVIQVTQPNNNENISSSPNSRHRSTAADKFRKQQRKITKLMSIFTTTILALYTPQSIGFLWTVIIDDIVPSWYIGIEIVCAVTAFAINGLIYSAYSNETKAALSRIFCFWRKRSQEIIAQNPDTSSVSPSPD